MTSLPEPSFLFIPNLPFVVSSNHKVPGICSSTSFVRQASFDKLRTSGARLPPDGFRLGREDAFAADAGEAEEAEKAFLVVTRAFGRGLDFGDLAPFQQDEVGVGVGRAVLDVVEV